MTLIIFESLHFNAIFFGNDAGIIYAKQSNIMANNHAMLINSSLTNFSFSAFMRTASQVAIARCSAVFYSSTNSVI